MSSAVSIHCPHCQQKLKFSDRSLLGRKVKCPGCKQPFVLAESVDASQPKPDHAGPGFTSAAGHAPLDFLAQGVAGGQRTSKGAEEPLFPRGPSPLDFLSREEVDDDTLRQPASRPHFPGKPSSPPDVLLEAVPLPDPVPQAAPAPVEFPLQIPSSGKEELNRLKRSRKRGLWVNSAVVGCCLLLAGGVIAYVMTRSKPPVAEPVANAQGDAAPAASSESPGGEKPYSRGLLESDESLVAEFEPTHGEPIQLYMMPSGVNLLVHLRPALLWSDGYDYRVLRASLTDEVTNWIASQLKEVCRREPSQIEEATLGFILGARGTAPQVCAVVRLVEPARMADLISEFPGKYKYDVTERPDFRMKVDDKFGYLIHDERTFVICPASLADELEFWVKKPNYEVSEGMVELLALSDRERLLTVIGGVMDLQLHLKSLLPEGARQTTQLALEWLGEDVDMISWSAHPEPYLHSKLLVRPVNTVDVLRLEKEFRQRLTELPEVVWKQVCAKMNPREMRFRQLIGRLPAMLEAFCESTVVSRGRRELKLTTVLPAKAAPNLALAALFTVNEAARTNFNPQPVAVAKSTGPKIPDTVVERMKLPVDAEFNRTPLEQALQYLCDEVHIKLFVDGDALKDAGYTKNMPQTFNLGKVPMQRALFEIINNYQETGKIMVISIDESTKTITVLTQKFAENKQLPIFPLKPE